MQKRVGNACCLERIFWKRPGPPTGDDGIFHHELPQRDGFRIRISSKEIILQERRLKRKGRALDTNQSHKSRNRSIF